MIRYPLLIYGKGFLFLLTFALFSLSAFNVYAFIDIKDAADIKSMAEGKDTAAVKDLDVKSDAAASAKVDPAKTETAEPSTSTSSAPTPVSPEPVTPVAETPKSSPDETLKSSPDNDKSAITIPACVDSKDCTGSKNPDQPLINSCGANNESLNKALTDFRSVSNNLPYLKAVREKLIKSRSASDPLVEQIDGVLNNKDFERYNAEFAKIYLSCLNNPKTESLFRAHLNKSEYFAKRLQLSVDKERNLFTEKVYLSKAADLLSQYADTIQLRSFDLSPEKISDLVARTYVALAIIEIELTPFERLTATAKDWGIILTSIFTIILGIATLKLSLKNYNLARENLLLAKRKDRRESKQPKKINKNSTKSK